MRATQRQLNKAADELAQAIDVEKYRALLNVAVLAINEREDKLAIIREEAEQRIVAVTELLQEKDLEIARLFEANNNLLERIEAAELVSARARE